MKDILDDILMVISKAGTTGGILTKNICNELTMYNERQIIASLAHLHDYRHFIAKTKDDKWILSAEGSAFVENGGFEARNKKKQTYSNTHIKDEELNSKSFLIKLFLLIACISLILFLFYIYRIKFAHK